MGERERAPKAKRPRDTQRWSPGQAVPRLWRRERGEVLFLRARGLWPVEARTAPSSAFVVASVGRPGLAPQRARPHGGEALSGSRFVRASET